MIKGRKRHILVDTLGMLVGTSVTDADIQDRDGVKAILAQATFDFARLTTIRADAGYASQLRTWVYEKCC